MGMREAKIRMLGDLVVWYLFLGGAGAGLLFVTAVLETLSPHAIDRFRAEKDHRYAPKELYGRFFGPAYGVGIATVVFGIACLLFDLGRSERALNLFLQPTVSFITVGAFALAALVFLAAILFIIWMFGIAALPRVFAVLVRSCCMVVAFAVMVYTGLFLSSMSAIELWSSFWLPVLFVVSALSTGLALLVCVVVLTGSGDDFTSTLRRVQKADVLVIICELAVLAAFVVSALFGG
ncbi:MAG: NrfD/PsrC family molybdoenzyme membrane anchor subunit, partial [Raoultibacter sp.]